MKKVMRPDHRLIAAKYMKKEKGFKFITLLGTGSYGTVIQMEDKQLGMVAVKIVNRRVENKVENAEWKNLNHPNVLRLIMMDDFLPSCIIFVTDLMKTNLTKQLNDKSHLEDPRAVSKNKRYLREILHGLSYLHRRNLCHLDLRADNVFLGFDGRAVIADFSGLCHADEKKNFCPLPKCFRPPEMFKGHKKNKVSPRPIDLWAFGLLVLHMFYLKKFCKLVVKQEARDSSEVVKNLGDFTDPMNVKFALARYYPACNPPGEFSLELSDFVSQFLQLKPQKRYSADQGLVHPFLIRGDTQICMQLSFDGLDTSRSRSPRLTSSRSDAEPDVRKFEDTLPETPSDKIIAAALNPKDWKDRNESCSSKKRLLDDGSTLHSSIRCSVDMEGDALSTVLPKCPHVSSRKGTGNDADSSDSLPSLQQRVETSMFSTHEDPDALLIEKDDGSSFVCHRKQSQEPLVPYNMEGTEIRKTQSSGGMSVDGAAGPSDLKSKWVKFRWKFNNMKRWKVK